MTTFTLSCGAAGDVLEVNREHALQCKTLSNLLEDVGEVDADADSDSDGGAIIPLPNIERHQVRLIFRAIEELYHVPFPGAEDGGGGGGSSAGSDEGGVDDQEGGGGSSSGGVGGGGADIDDALPSYNPVPTLQSLPPTELLSVLEGVNYLEHVALLDWICHEVAVRVAAEAKSRKIGALPFEAEDFVEREVPQIHRIPLEGVADSALGKAVAELRE